MKRLKVVRVLVLEGPEDLVESILAKSWMSPGNPKGGTLAGGVSWTQTEVARATEEIEE